MELHMLNNHDTQEQRMEKFKYYCELCDFGTLTKLLFDNYINTNKHSRIIKIEEQNIKNNGNHIIFKNLD